MESVWLDPLTDDEMLSQGLSQSDVWMIKHGEDVYGPYEPTALHNHALQHESFYQELLVSLVADENWVPFFSAAPFKKRKPQLVSASTLQAPQRFWILHLGHRNGPHSMEEIQSRLQAGQLVATDLISADEGATWQRACEHKYLKLLQHTSSELPQAPDDDWLDLANPPPFDHGDMRESLASLAHISKPRESVIDQVMMNKSRAFILKSDLPEPRFQFDRKKWAIGASAAMVLIVATVSFNTTTTSPEYSDYQNDRVASDVAPHEVELVPAGTSVLDEPPTRQVSRPRRTFTQQTSRNVPSPRAMNGARRDIARYEESHDDNVESPAEVDPPEVGLYPEDFESGESAMRNASERTPSSEQTLPDDGYRMEGDEDPQTEPSVIEEVGDF